MDRNTKNDIEQVKKDVILFSYLTTKDYLKDILSSPNLDEEDRSLAEDLIFFIDCFIKQDYSDKSENISKPNWNELKNC